MSPTGPGKQVTTAQDPEHAHDPLGSDHEVAEHPSKTEPTRGPENTTPSSSRISSRANSKTCLIWSSIFIVVVVCIVLATVLTRKEPEVAEPPPPEVPPVSVLMSTGVSLVTSYAIESVIRSRLARTTITMEVANALDCSSIHAISLQLPLNTRIASLKTTANDGCITSGKVQELGEARETFIESAKQGLPSAYVEQAQDSFTHSLQVSIPPLGNTHVELVLEQLLKQRLGEVKFEIPMAPNEEVDAIVFDLQVEDTSGQLVDFQVDLNVPGVFSYEDSNSTNAALSTAPIHLDIPDARQYE